MLAGTDAAFSAKRRTEGERGADPTWMGDVLDGMRCLAEKRRRRGRHAGCGEEGHRRLTNEMANRRASLGPGHPGSAGSKTRECPGPLGIALMRTRTRPTARSFWA